VTDPQAVRALAAEIGRPGVPVSLRDRADAPQPAAGSGYWRRQVARLVGTIERSRDAVLEVPAGGVRDELERLVGVLRRRAERYIEIAKVGQAVAPDDDTTNADGTAPGQRPTLDGAASEIDSRLDAAIAHLTTVAEAIELIASAAAGATDAERVGTRLGELFAQAPGP
jgi:hypothetical protein